MSIRRIAVLLAAAGLAVGLVGGGVGAQFTDQVLANQNISVGTFSCHIVAPSDGTIAADGKSVTFTSPTIQSSLPGSAPFSFTVQNTGTIPDALVVSASPALSSPWSYIPVAPAGAVPLAGGDSQTFKTGVQWTELSNADLGKSATVTFTVNCGENDATVTFRAVGGGPGSNSMTDYFTGAGFLHNAPLTIYEYRFGSPTPFDLNKYFGNPVVTDSSGAFSESTADDCHPTPENGPATYLDMPVVVWASDGTHTAVGTGIIPCGTQF